MIYINGIWHDVNECQENSDKLRAEIEALKKAVDTPDFQAVQREAEIIRLRAALEAVRFPMIEYKEGEFFEQCPVCDGLDGHKSDCKLKIALGLQVNQ